MIQQKILKICKTNNSNNYKNRSQRKMIEERKKIISENAMSDGLGVVEHTTTMKCKKQKYM